MAYWLLKTEPGTYSYQQLLKDRKTNWSGVRNFQARNNLRAMKKGDIALIYHSGDEKAAVGVAKVVREAYPDPEPGEKAEWVQVDLAPEKPLARPVTLGEIRLAPPLKDILLVRHTRLSVMPISAAHFQAIVKMGAK